MESAILPQCAPLKGALMAEESGHSSTQAWDLLWSDVVRLFAVFAPRFSKGCAGSRYLRLIDSCLTA